MITTTRSAREPRPTSPRRPSASALARVYGTRNEPATAAIVKTTATSLPARAKTSPIAASMALADAVGRGVEEGAERRGLPAGARERPVEDVEDRADDEDHRAEPVEEDLVAALEGDENEPRRGRA